MAVALIPRTVLSSPESARRRVVAIAAAGSMCAALAGIWLRFEDGLLMRLTIATTSAFFGAIATSVALKAKNGHLAAGRALGLSILLGIASTVIPSAILASSQNGTPFAACLIAGVFFGGFVGFWYGIGLAILCSLVWRHLDASTHDGADRATRVAALWALVPLFFSVLVAISDGQRVLSEYASESDRAAHAVAMPLGLAGAAIVFAVAGLSLVVAEVALSRRRRWLSRVTAGEDPRFRVREIGPHDDVPRLPRLRDGSSVLELRDAAGAYRANATGVGVAIV
jgi:hypothetical protein